VLTVRSSSIGKGRKTERKKAWSPPAVGHFKIQVDAGLSRQGDRGAVAALCGDD
jgi:hypothetical protein